MASVTELFSGIAGNEAFVDLMLFIILKSSVILLLALTVTKIFSTLSAAKKHLIWATSFLIVFLMPLLILVLPHWKVPVTENEPLSIQTIDNTRSDYDQSNELLLQPVNKSESEPTEIPVTAKTSPNENQSSVQTEVENRLLIPALYTNLTAVGKSFISENSFLFAIQLIWITGVVVLFLKQMLAHLLIHRIYKNSVELDDPVLNSIFFKIKAGYNISRLVELLKNDKVKSPMTWGILSPKIVIPSEMESWSKEKKRLALIHEFAHIKRSDIGIQFMARLVCIIQWFNPLVWISYSRMSTECEHACDDYVLEKCKNPSNYAELLLEVASFSLKWNFKSPAAITMARRKFLEKRLLSIFDNKPGSPKISWTAAFTILCGICLLAIPLIMFTPSEESIAKPVKTDKTSRSALTGVTEPFSSRIPNTGRQTEYVVSKDTSTIKVLTEILYDDDQEIRLQAAESLGKIGTAEAVSSVIVSLPRNGWNDLDEVVEIFNTLKDPYPIQALMKSIKNKETDIRQEAVFALNDAPSLNALEPLCQYMDDENSEIREEAGKGLGRIGVPKALDCLTLHTKDENENVRIEVIEAIGNIQDKKAVPALSEALNDRSWKVREEAASALGAIKDTAAVKPLVLALNDQQWRVRDEAAEALGKIGDSSAIESLTNALNKESENEVKREIMEAIGDIYSKSN